jgi:phycocyanin-associated rod protein
MLGQSSISRKSSATSDNRIFVYEVTGLQQNEVTNQCDHQIRTSSNTFMQVPLDRMNETMQRITKLGGKIVSIHPLDAITPSVESAPKKGKKSHE